MRDEGRDGAQPLCRPFLCRIMDGHGIEFDCRAREALLAMGDGAAVWMGMGHGRRTMELVRSRGRSRAD